RTAGLRLPEAVVLLRDEADLTDGLAVPKRIRAVLPPRRVGAARARERIQELGQLRLDLAADGGDPERGERDDVTVELADPVDQTVAACVPDNDVEAGAAVGAILVGRVRAVGHVAEIGRADGRAAVAVAVEGAARREVVV